MLDNIKFLDDATRPEAPTFDNLTPHQRAPGRHLSMIHNHFRQNMEVLRDAIKQAKAGEVSPQELKERVDAMTMMQNYRQFGALCGQHCQIIEMHHSIEDQSIFPPLSAKSAAFAKVTARLIEEHEIVHELLVGLVKSLQTLIENPNAATFADANEIYDVFERVLLSHFGYEEKSIGDALGYYEIGV